jgi:hypothetical protein
MNQIQLIKHFSKNISKVLASHGAETEYFSMAFFQLQAAKNGLDIKEITPWAQTELDRQKKITLAAI